MQWRGITDEEKGEKEKKGVASILKMAHYINIDYQQTKQGKCTIVYGR